MGRKYNSTKFFWYEKKPLGFFDTSDKINVFGLSDYLDPLKCDFYVFKIQVTTFADLGNKLSIAFQL